MNPVEGTAPGARDARAAARTTNGNVSANSSTVREQRRNRWRQRMPDAAEYYRRMLDGLRESMDGWFTARCPFHDDKHASLSVNGRSGRWRCHANHDCGTGDLIAFHMRITGKDFKAAVADLTGVRL